MRKYIILIPLLITLANGWLHAQTITLSIPDTSVVSGNLIDVPIFVDNSLTGKDITAYTLQLSFDQYYFQAISVIVAGTLSAPFGTPAYNTSIPGKITIAGAGSTPLTGIGKLITIRFKALHPGGSWISFTDSQYNFFNEGIPAISLDEGYASITTPPTINVYPDNGTISKGEQMQFYVSGGTAPFQWSVNNPSVATIDANGLLTGIMSGFAKVEAIDINGLQNTTDLIEIRAIRLSIPSDLSQWQGADIDVPVNTTDLTDLNIYSGNLKLGFNQNILTPVGIVQTGTLLASFPLPEYNIGSPGSFSLAFAGSNPLAGSGTLIYVRFHVSFQNTGTTDINFSDILFSETLLSTFTNGRFTTIDLPVLTISPNTGYLVAGEKQQFTVNGEASPPLTWSVNNTIATSINQSGFMTANRSGIVTVKVNDAMGATAQSGNFQIYDSRINMPDTLTCPETMTFDYPIQIKSLSSGEPVYSIQGTINYDATYLTLQDIEAAGTLTQGWTYEKNTSIGQLFFAGSGNSSFNSSGTILKLKFTVNPNLLIGSRANVNLNNVILNEGFPFPLVDINGSILRDYPVIAGTVYGAATVCSESNSKTLTLSGQNGNVIKWQSSTDDWATSFDISHVTPTFTATNITATTKFRAVVQIGDCSPKNSDEVTVTVNPLPAALAGADRAICLNTSTQIGAATVTGSTYSWTSSPAGFTSPVSNPTVSPTVTTTYTLVETITVTGCTNSHSVVVTVNPLPAALAGADRAICLNTNTQIGAATVIGSTFSWTSSPVGFTSTVSNPTVSPAVTTTYTLVETITATGCTNSHSVVVTVNPLPASAGSISGSEIVTPGQSDVIYTVPVIQDADSYIWTLPEGSTVTSTTNSISVSFGSNAVSGEIKVKGHNDCGNGKESPLAITVNSLVTQTISLNTGWNIISANVIPANLNLKTIFQPLIDSGKLKKVMDESGKALENFGALGGWKNNIGNLGSTEGYKVNVTETCILNMSGAPVNLPLDIPLTIGWNIISFPADASQNALTVFQPLIDAGKLKKVMDESGKAIENFGAFGGWKNNIGNMNPGKGFKVNMASAGTLTLPASGTKSALVLPELLASTHFTTVFKGNGTDHMNINLLELSKSGIRPGDEIGVFDGSLCAGSALVGLDQILNDDLCLPVSGNDELQASANGFTQGNPIVLKLFREGNEFLLFPELLNNSQLHFAKGESMFAKVSFNLTNREIDFTNQLSVKCYPNPFSEQVSIEIQLARSQKLTVNIYDVNGKLIRKLFKGEAEGKKVLVWDGKNDAGAKMVTGSYYVKVNTVVEKVLLR